jgi:hypothetical protein
VQIDRQRVHGYHFVGFGPGELAKPRGREPVIGQPRTVRLKVSFDPETRPVFEFFLHVSHSVLWLQAERVTAEIDGRPAVPRLREVEAGSERAEFVRGVQ